MLKTRNLQKIELKAIVLLLMAVLAVLFVHSEISFPEGCGQHHELHDFCTLVSAALTIDAFITDFYFPPAHDFADQADSVSAILPVHNPDPRKISLLVPGTLII